MKCPKLIFALFSGVLLVAGCGGGGSRDGAAGDNGSDTADSTSWSDGDDVNGRDDDPGAEGGDGDAGLAVAAYRFETDARDVDRDDKPGLRPILSSAPPSCRPDDGDYPAASLSRTDYSALPFCSDMRWESYNVKGLTTWIDATVFVPEHREGETLPVVLHSHGWGDSKLTGLPVSTPERANLSLPEQALGALRDEGYIVVSFSQRGWGKSEGDVMAMNPYFEVQDAIAVLDWIAGMGRRGELPVAVDEQGDFPLALIGGGYGGGSQLLLAALDSRADAVVAMGAPHSLSQSLLPNGTVKGGTIGFLCFDGVSSGAYHPYLEKLCSDTSAASGVLWALLSPLMPLLSDHTNQQLRLKDLPGFAIDEGVAGARRVGATLLYELLARLNASDKRPLEVAEELSREFSKLLQKALLEGIDNGDVDFSQALKGWQDPEFLKRLLPLVEPLIMSSDAFAGFRPAAMLEGSGEITFPVDIDFEKIADFEVPIKALLTEYVFPTLPAPKQFASDLDPQGQLLDFLNLSGLSYLRDLERQGEAFRVGAEAFSLRPLDVLLVHGMSDTVFPLQQAFDNYRYLSGKGGDVRLLTHQGGAVHPLLPADPHGLNCGRIHIVNAIRHWTNTTVRGVDSSAAADIPSVCLSLDDDAALVPEHLPGIDDKAGLLPARSFQASVSTPEDGGATAQCVPVYRARNEEALAGVPVISDLSITGSGRQQAQMGLCLRRDGHVSVLGEQLQGFDSDADHGGAVKLSGVGALLQPGDEVGVYVSSESGQFNFGGGEGDLLLKAEPVAALFDNVLPDVRVSGLLSDTLAPDRIYALIESALRDAAPTVTLDGEEFALGEKGLELLDVLGFDLKGRLTTFHDDITGYSNTELLRKLSEGMERYVRVPEASYTVSGNLLLPIVARPETAL